MNYERRYNEILAAIKKLQESNSSDEGIQNWVEDNVPELCESKDERIKKIIKQSLKSYFEGKLSIDTNDTDYAECLAWLEKQGEHQKFANKEYTFKAIPRLLEMIQPTDRAKSYCQKLIDSLEQEGYSTDAKIVRERLKLMNGEEVAMATMDEQKPTKNIVEIWKDMRLEVYQQASGNRHEANYSDDTTKMYSLNDIDEIVEKISEQQSANKVEPAFKVGDWVIGRATGNEPRQIAEITEEGYKSTYGGWIGFSFEEDMHLWILQDAKAGDVLAFDDNTIVIFKDLYNATTFHSYCHVEEGAFSVSRDEIPDWWEGKGFYPATKEQRDKLENAMLNAGYKWNKEKLKLEKI